MVAALDNRIGIGRRFGGGATMSAAWEQDAAAGFVEQLFAAHHSEIYAYLIRMLRDPELARLYLELARAESRHHGLFFRLARHYFSEQVTGARAAELLDFEAELVTSLPHRPAVH